MFEQRNLRRKDDRRSSSGKTRFQPEIELNASINDVTRDCADGEFNSILALFDHLIRSHQHVRRNRHADLLGCFQIDDELELFWLLDREITGISAF